MIGRLWTLFTKEMLDNLRDRRSLAMAFLFPLVGPAVLVLIIVATAQVVEDDTETPVALPVAGAEHAPGLVAFLRENGVQAEAPPASPDAAVRTGDVPVVLVIPEEYPAQLAAAEPAVVLLVVDQSERSSHKVARRVEQLVSGYGRQLGALRLLARGVHPSVADAVVIDALDVSTPQGRSAMFLAVMPMFIVLGLFLGGFYIAIDSTAGERERGSLEPLVTNPVARWEIVVGKLAATWVFSVACLGVMVAGFSVVTHLVPIAYLEAVSIERHVGFALAVRMFLLMLPLSFFASALQMAIASLANSFKDAQNYISMLMMVAMLPGIVLSVMTLTERAWMMLVPTLGEQVLMLALLRDKALPDGWLLMSNLTAAVLGVALAAVAVRLYRSDRVVLSRG